jgi:hypothetical protein
MSKSANTDQEFTRQMQALIRLQITMKEIQRIIHGLRIHLQFPEKNYFVYNNTYEGRIGKKMILESISSGNEE